MNWTGGTLQRTKTANKSVIQKQKAYFARARTQLQQSSATPITPFRPDYLNDRSDGGDSELRHHLPSPRKDSIHHDGYSATKPHELDRCSASPTARRSHREHSSRKSHQENPRSTQKVHQAELEKEMKRDRKFQLKNVDIETQLLEANRKRLLKQQDWIGVEPSRPVNLPFLSIKEKSRIGKRRKVERKSKAVTRRKSPTTFAHRSGRDELGDHGSTLMTGALPPPVSADNIRVRIGSDALTTIASTQAPNYAHSQTNSDSMLFDEEDQDIAPHLETCASMSVVPSGYTLAANPRSTDNYSAKSDKHHLPQHGKSANHCLTVCPDDHAEGHLRHNQAESNISNQSVQQSEVSDPSYHITHDVRGVQRPLKLVFGRRSPKAIHTASSAIQIDETHHAHAYVDVKNIDNGQTNRNAGEARRISVGRHTDSPAFVDDQPWRAYLNMDGPGSGQVFPEDGTGTSVPQPHIPARNIKADRTKWPQHTTQGNLTYANLSAIPTSLPASRQPSGHLPDARPQLRTAAIKNTDKHEELWRSFVLGSDPQSAIDTVHTHDNTNEDTMSRATKGYASTRVPLSAAVTSVSSTPLSSTPFRSVSEQAYRISADAQYAPHSGTRSATSVAPTHAVWGRAKSAKENVQGESQSEEPSARSHFGERSIHVLQDSLQNHASYESKVSRDTRTSRNDLVRCDHTQGYVWRREQASGSGVWRRSRSPYSWNIPESDEAGIDLIDPDRLI